MTAIPAGPIRFLHTITAAAFTFEAGTIAMYDGKGQAMVRLAPGVYFTVQLTFPQRMRGIEAASMTVANP